MFVKYFKQSKILTKQLSVMPGLYTYNAACKNLGDISYINRVIADFVSNFVAIATGSVVVKFD